MHQRHLQSLILDIFEVKNHKHFAFAFNAKSFAIAFLVFFFLFFLFVTFSGRTAKSFLVNVLP